MIDWAALRHAYGPAVDVPGNLAALRSADGQRRLEAFGDLYASITHQGNRYSASAAAVPSLLELVADPAVPDRDLLLYLLGRIAVGDDAAWLPRGVRRADLDADEVNAYDAVGAGLPLLDTLTADPGLADSAAYLLGWYPGRPGSVPVLAALHTPTAIVALGLVGRPEGAPIAERALTDERPLVRWAAAVALARLRGEDPSGELRRWATGGQDTGGADAEPSVAYLGGDLGGLALLSLESIGGEVLGPALDRLRHVSAGPALTTVGVLLRQAFPRGPVAADPTFDQLTACQQRVVRALAGTPSAWLYDDAEFADVSLLVSDYGLPHGRERLAAYAR
ncbi:HEAT repeat domain-containing protein [Actinoplanes philippinensis]|uniref:HEAT repeat domain-containing protein n=1 Tax=Actinoplanes philippinensis TaxID=35752 RepID=UPI0033C3EBD5